MAEEYRTPAQELIDHLEELKQNIEESNSDMSMNNTLHEYDRMKTDIIQYECIEGVVFMYRGYELEISRHLCLGFLRGYIRPDQMMMEYEEELERYFHQGMTAYFGFDCGHYCDFYIGCLCDYVGGCIPTYKDFQFVKKTLQNVVDRFYEL